MKNIFFLFSVILLTPVLSFSQAIAVTASKTVGKVAAETSGKVVGKKILQQGAHIPATTAKGLSPARLEKQIKTQMTASVADMPTPLSTLKTNIMLPSGTLPVYATPVSKSVNATEEIYHLFNGTDYRSGLTLQNRLAEQVPDYVVLWGGQITQEQLNILRRFYRGKLESYVNMLKADKITIDEWAQHMTIMTDLGFFGTKEDAALIVEFAENVPFEFRQLTDFTAVRALLNLKDYNALVNLGEFRMNQERWFEEGVSGKEAPTRAVHAEVRLWMRNQPVLKDIVDSVYPAELTHFDRVSFLPAALYDDTEALIGKGVTDDKILAQHNDYLAFKLRAQNNILYRMVTQQSSLDDLNSFLKLKEDMPPLLP